MYLESPSSFAIGVFINPHKEKVGFYSKYVKHESTHDVISQPIWNEIFTQTQVIFSQDKHSLNWFEAKLEYS